MRQSGLAELELALLADRPDAASTVAGWYFNEWGRKRPGNTPKRIGAKIQGSLNRDRVPLIVLAVQGGEVVGAAELKYREMDIYPEKEYWLGGVFVVPRCRGGGVASLLASRVMEIAKSFGIHVLYLQTEHMTGGLYARLGWKPVENVQYKGTNVLVMECATGA